jgi:ABC-2 type transport system permease protein
MVDGFRHGFFGVSDVAPAVSFLVVAVFLTLVMAIALRMLSSGYKLRL